MSKSLARKSWGKIQAFYAQQIETTQQIKNSYLLRCFYPLGNFLKRLCNNLS